MTRTSPRHDTSGECHRLNFFHDKDDGCALTTLVRGFRFHIIADATQLKASSKKGHELESKYRSLIHAVQEEAKKEDNPEYEKKKEEYDAKVHDVSKSHDSGIDSGNTESTQDVDDDDNDSAVDVSQPNDDPEINTKKSVNQGELTEEERKDPETALQNWMLDPFHEIFADLDEPENNTTTGQSLQEWFSGPTYFYNIEIKNDQLTPVELDSEPDLEKRISDLVPHMHVPKYIKQMDIPWFHPKDLEVISESDEPDPFHPSLVKIGDDVHFFKLVDSTQPQPVKRELKILKEIESKGLHKKMRVPLVTGLVGYEDSKTDIIGFLLTDIEDPTPLTKLLDSDVIEEKREMWAMESERVVRVLHENDIIWGDAKADNFMVDKHGELWIIDFGGSYTDGWVDPELMETKAGDIMGVEKIVNALEDPEANTYEPGDGVENEEAAIEKDQSSSKNKKRSHIGEEDESRSPRSSKKAKSSS